MKTLRESFTSFTVAAVAAISLSMTVAAKDPEEVTIKVEKSDQHQAKVVLVVDGQTEKFDMPELAVGETQTITSESGNNIVVTKNDEGMLLTLDGKEVKLPNFHGNLGAKLHRSMPLQQMVSKGIQISGVKLDDTQKQIIRDAFLTAGVEQPINFNSQAWKVIHLQGEGKHGDIEVEHTLMNDGLSSASEQGYEIIVEQNQEGSALNSDGAENQKVKKHIIIKK